MNPTEVNEGDVIRVSRQWPGTRGKRYVVTGFETSERFGECATARELEGARIYTFPLSLCRVDVRGTREAKERAEA